HQRAMEAAQEHAHKLEAVYHVHGREGLREFCGEDVCFLYWCVQHEIKEITEKIGSSVFGRRARVKSGAWRRIFGSTVRMTLMRGIVWVMAES
ncbi:MAG TPA: hypothetical protein VG826_29835, partial [Pirellulales bacterium]|nr:hypothetical protein [Pirellulales bacterium]